MKVQVRFKGPDLIYELTNAQHPLPADDEDITPRLEKAREEFCEKYFKYGDYGCIEIDGETLAGRLLPRKEWSK